MSYTVKYKVAIARYIDTLWDMSCSSGLTVRYKVYKNLNNDLKNFFLSFFFFFLIDNQQRVIGISCSVNGFPIWRLKWMLNNQIFLLECLKLSLKNCIGVQWRVLSKCYECRAPQGLCGWSQRLHVWVTWKCLSSPPCVISINNKGPDGGNLLAYFWVPGSLVSHSARKTAPLYFSVTGANGWHG